MVKIYTSEEINKIASSGKILSKTLKLLKDNVKTGVSLKYLDKLSHDFVKENNAEPAFLGYRPESANRSYPSSICASLNNVVVHGIPIDYELKDGDVLKIDMGVRYGGFYSDAAFTVIVGRGSEEAKNLVKATRDALNEVVRHVMPGNRLGDLGFVISKVAKRFGVNVITGLTGHGIGRELHEDPIIYNFGDPGHGLELKPGMVLAIEPMFSAGTSQIIQLKDDSWATKDGSLAAHFEHTVAVTDKGPIVLTD